MGDDEDLGPLVDVPTPMGGGFYHEVALSASSGGVTGASMADLDWFLHPWDYPDRGPTIYVDLFPRARRVWQRVRRRVRPRDAWRVLIGNAYIDD